MKEALIKLTKSEYAKVCDWADGKTEVPRHCEFECECELLFYRNAEYTDGTLVEVFYTPGSHGAVILLMTKADGRVITNVLVPTDELIAKYKFSSKHGTYELLVELTPDITTEAV